MKFDSGKASIWTVILASLLFVFLSLSISTKVSATANTCTPYDGYSTRSSDGTSDHAIFDFNGNKTNVSVSAESGYTITEVWLDVQDDNHSGYYQYGTVAGSYNPNPGGEINFAKVRVVKTCATPTATPTATSEVKKVYVCKYVGTPGQNETLQSGQNPIEVSINALPGNWSVGNYFNDNQGRSFVLATVPQDPEPSVNDCPQTSVTPTPTATATSTSNPTPTPTDNNCGDDCNQPTPTATATATSNPTVTPTPFDPDLCKNIDGVQTSVPEGLHLSGANNDQCVAFSQPGVDNPSGPANTQGQVLGASTMASTGTFTENLYLAIMTLGATISSIAFASVKKAFQKA